MNTKRSRKQGRGPTAAELRHMLSTIRLEETEKKISAGLKADGVTPEQYTHAWKACASDILQAMPEDVRTSKTGRGLLAVAATKKVHLSVRALHKFVFEHAEEVAKLAYFPRLRDYLPA